eukprot:gene3344-4192_t
MNQNNVKPSSSRIEQLFKFRSSSNNENDNNHNNDHEQHSSEEEIVVFEYGFKSLQSTVLSALSIYSILKTSLGPRSMSKLILKSNGEYIVTNDGANILKCLNVQQHPVADVLVNIALSQDREVGDGTTSVVILAGEILRSLSKLIIAGGVGEGSSASTLYNGRPIHQTTLTKILYQLGQYTQSILDSISIPFDKSDMNVLLKLAGVSLGTKHYSYWTQNLSKITLDAIENSTISLDNNNNNNGDSNSKFIDIKKNIQIVKIAGGNIDQSEFKKGFILETLSPPILRYISTIKNNIKCIVIGFDILKYFKSSKSIHTSIQSIDDIDQYYKLQESFIYEFLKRVLSLSSSTNPDENKIPDILIQLLQINKIDIIHGFKEQEKEEQVQEDDKEDDILEKLSILLNLVPVMQFDYIDKFNQKSIIGELEQLELISKQDSHYLIHLKKEETFLSSLILKGPTIDLVDDLEIGIIDSLHLIKSSIESPPRIVYGGGCCEMSISQHLLKYSNQLEEGSLEKVVCKCLSECFTIIPLILSMNCGVNALDIIAKLSLKHQQHLNSNSSSSSGNSSCCSWGVDGWTGEIKDMKEMNIIEPVVLKKSIINIAIEACITLLRIDTTVISK